MSHQKFPPQYIFIIYLWSCDTGCGGTWRCAVQTSLQGIVAQLLGVLPVGNLKHQAACSDPSRWRYKDLAIGCARTTLKGHLHSRCPMGSAKVIQPVIQLDLSFCPIPFLPSWFHTVDSKGSPDKHPSTKLNLSLHSREPACNMYQKTFQYSGRTFIWKLLVTYVLKTF